eukprot:1587532-Prymnesium_polylepis.2
MHHGQCTSLARGLRNSRPKAVEPERGLAVCTLASAITACAGFGENVTSPCNEAARRRAASLCSALVLVQTREGLHRAHCLEHARARVRAANMFIPTIHLEFGAPECRKLPS